MHMVEPHIQPHPLHLCVVIGLLEFAVFQHYDVHAVSLGIHERAVAVPLLDLPRWWGAVQCRHACGCTTLRTVPHQQCALTFSDMALAQHRLSSQPCNVVRAWSSPWPDDNNSLSSNFRLHLAFCQTPH
jgi:hypothetical protein